MCGFNGQEGAAVTMLGMFLKSGTVGLNTSLTRNGYTMDMAKEVILNTCQMMTPMSANDLVRCLLKVGMLVCGELKYEN